MVTDTDPDRSAQPDGRVRGLTVREHVASMAMQGLIAKYGANGNGGQTIVADAIALADELITELNK